MNVFTRQSVRAVDRIALERFHMPGIVLMENAARGLVDHTLQFVHGLFRNRHGEDHARWPVHPDAYPSGLKVLIVCGGGNNGGDGLAAARLLHNYGVQPTIVLTRPPEQYTGDARINLDIVAAMNLPRIVCSDDNPIRELASLGDHHVLLDGLFGTGLTDTVRDDARRIIDWMNARPERIVAIDIPSGLDCDTGEPLGAAVRAAMTVTFVGVKRGFLQPRARPYVGSVKVVDIGVPRELAAELGASMSA